LKEQLPALLEDAWQSRTVVERLALALEGSLVVRFSPAVVADAFCASRLTPEGGRAFGTLPPGLDMRAIIDRAWPA
jgi:putative acyl-CoA dehydrogenase